MGVEYLCDWANDDQPYFIGDSDRSLISLPLMQDVSDVNLHWNRRVTMAQWSAVVCEAFDTLYREVDGLSLLSEALNFDFAKKGMDEAFTSEELEGMSGMQAMRSRRTWSSEIGSELSESPSRPPRWRRCWTSSVMKKGTPSASAAIVPCSRPP